MLFGDGLRGNTIIRDEMVFFAVVSGALASAGMISAVICTVNFGRGLKQVLPMMEQEATPMPSTEDLGSP